MKMDHLTQIIIAIFASSGFWALLNQWLQSMREKKTASTERVDTLERGVRGLLHEKLIERCNYYIARGDITEGEYRDLEEYIYTPYHDLSGNGTGDEYMKRCKELLFVKTEV